MMNRHSTFVAILFILAASCQPESSGLLERGAIVIDDPSKINKKAIERLVEYDAILLGELHGTNECAELMQGLAKVFARNGERVLVGFELPHDQLEGIDDDHSIETIRKSSFFSDDYQDGRGSTKWAETVSTLMSAEHIDVVFFDNTSEEWNNAYWVSRRDSLMFEKINAAIAKYEPTKLITITGNTHNQLQAMWTDATMGHYLETHPRSYLLGRKILSLVNVYDGGSAMNNTGNGLEYQDMGQRDSSVFTNFGADNYIFIYEDKDSLSVFTDMSDWQVYGYNGMYFTKSITAAAPFD
jgi:hypothetical protein